MADVSVTARAYSKVLLHAAKYPHRAVNGVLLVEKSKKQDVKTLRFVDAIPLFHLTLGLAPMMEVALTQVDAFCKSQGLAVGGYYQANENIVDSEPSSIAYRIGERIQSHYKDACLFMIDNEKMSIECSDEVFIIWQYHEGKWKRHSQKNVVEKGGLEAASFLLEARSYRDLIDFDNHLDNILLDWKNLEINELLKHAS